METTIGNSVQQVNPYSNPSANQKNSSEKVTDASEEARAAKTAENEGEAAEKTDTVRLSSTRFVVSQTNQASSETEIEDIDRAVEKIQEVREWLESEYASSQVAQVHNLNAGNLVEILS